MILSRYTLSLMSIGIPLDIIRFINIIYLQCENEEIAQKIYPCKSGYCKWFFCDQSKPGKKTCCNFLHKTCILVHCQEMNCHNIICINRFQKSFEEKWIDSTLEGYIKMKVGNENCKCKRKCCDTCNVKTNQSYNCRIMCSNINYVKY
jgi:hypothetical protein